ncbi:MAG: hypothetical protein WAN14_14275 [Candidatus Acidiferrales bacterium]
MNHAQRVWHLRRAMSGLALPTGRYTCKGKSMAEHAPGKGKAIM